MAVGRTAEEIRGQTKAVRQFHRSADQAIEQLLVLARTADTKDPEVAAALFEAAGEIGRSGQARQGQTVQVLAEADRVKSRRVGLAPWIATHLDCTDSGARGFARSVREIGHLPELFEPLSSGRIGAPTIRVLARAARAAKNADTNVTNAVTATLATATGEGVERRCGRSASWNRTSTRAATKARKPGNGDAATYAFARQMAA